jgi:heptosyltransferase-2
MEKEKIIIFGPSWIGDMVMAQSLFMNLLKRNKNVEIHLAAPEWSVGLCKKFPEIKKVIPLSFKHGRLDLIKRISLSLQLRNEKYTEVIYLINSFKSVFSTLFSNIKVRTGYLGEFRYLLLNNIHRKQNEPTLKEFIKLSVRDDFTEPKLIYPKLKPNKNNALKFLKKNKIPNKNIVVIAPGAEYGPAKRFPENKFTYLVNKFLIEKFNVLIVGSEKDKQISRNIIGSSKNVYDLTGKTTISEVIDIIGISKFFISNDSGLMHVAAALNIPQEAIFGSSDPLHTPPRNNKAHITYLGLSCSPCFKRECPLGHLDCLNQINEKKLFKDILCQIKK